MAIPLESSSSSETLKSDSEEESASENVNVNSLEDEAADDSSPTLLNKRNIPNSPFELDSILEVLFGFLDVVSLKNIRLVNSFWKSEATKKLLEKSFIRIPLTFYSLSRKRRRVYKASLLTLLQTPCKRYSARHLLINNSKDMQLLQAMFSEDCSFWLDIWNLKFGDECNPPGNAEMLMLLKKLKNLTLFGSRHLLDAYNEPSDWDLNYIEPFVLAGRADLVQYFSFDMDLRMEPPDIDTLDFFETFSKENTKLRHLSLLMYGANEMGGVANQASFRLWPRMGQALTKIYESSKDTLEDLSICHEIGLLQGLKYSRLEKLTRITFYLTSGDPQPLGGFQYAAHFPNLKGCTIQIDGREERYAPGLWNSVFPRVGQSLSCKELDIYSSDIDIASVSKTFPAVQKLELVNLMDFQSLGKSLWTCYKNIQILELNLMASYPENVYPCLDSTLTGFSVESLKRLERQGAGSPRGEKNSLKKIALDAKDQDYDYDEDEDDEYEDIDDEEEVDNDDDDDDNKKYEKNEPGSGDTSTSSKEEELIESGAEPKREFPSLLQLTELKSLHIHFNCGRMMEVPKSFKLIGRSAVEYAFIPMRPKLKVKLSVSARDHTLKRQFEATLAPLRELFEI